MATYPVVLYPRLLAEFRKSYPKNRTDNPTLFPSDRRASRPTAKSHTLSESRVFAQRFIGSALCLIGIGFSKNCPPLGLLTILTGSLTFLTPSVQRFLLQRRALKSNSKEWFPTIESVEGAIPNSSVAKNSLKTYLSSLSETMRGKVLQPDGVTDAPVGASEAAFGWVLEKYFPGRVRSQLMLPIPNWDGAYSTDFTISFPELGIWIDCEIDEPYDYKTGNPTHCISDERDRNRNKFFLNSNWIVIRFAEEQVVKYPESCCKEIADTISSITRLNAYAKLLAAYPSLKPGPMWTATQAKKFSKSRYRDKYLRSA